MESQNQKAAGSEEKEAMMIDECHDRSDSESHEEEARVEIPSDHLAVQILARLDGHAYKQALYKDAGSINDNFLLPPQFPWHSRKRLPQRMKTMPRDIDDLHVVSRCDEELFASSGDFAGAFGFGRYENGQSRGNYCDALPAESLSKDGTGASAAARRSNDPGVLELHVSTKLPPSLDAVMDPKQPPEAQAPAKKWRAELMKDPVQAEMLSSLPFNLGGRGEPSSSVPQPMDRPGSDTRSDEEIDSHARKLNQSMARSKAELDVAASCRRKLSISMKVNGVSSRTTVFPQSTVLAERASENTRKVLRPMLCLASLPQTIRTGETVSTDKAREMDRGGLAQTLGSYDCRVADALVNPKKDSSGRSKRTTVGRTRLVWSSLIRGDEPFLPSTRNRVSFNSLITGQRVDASKCLRPTEVKVAVRLNGSILMEEALEEIPATTTSNVRKRTRQAENHTPKPRKLVVPDSRTVEEVDAAMDMNCVRLGNPEEGKVIRQRAKNGTVVYLEMGSHATHSELDRNDIIASLLKFGQKKAPKRLKSAPIDLTSADASLGTSQAVRRSSPPRFACVPLEDGILRTICLNAGNMAGSEVHQIIREASGQESEDRRCSVCWSDEGSGKDGVVECTKCGLLAHTACCRDTGEFSPASGAQMNGHGAAVADGEPSNDHAESWQCAVCCRFTENKPRRNPRMPSRFVGGETYAVQSSTDVITANANTPGPRCALCPHRGGAMSPMDPSDASGLWAHEVCRVWGGMGAADSSSVNVKCSFSQLNGSPLSNVCALCGSGGAGLTRCAARGCLVAFHPMCALLSNKVGTEEKSAKAKAARTRKTRHTEQTNGGAKSDANESIEADKRLCREYTLQLVQVSRSDLSTSRSSEDDATATIAVSFCGIHNAKRDDRFFGCLPGGAAI
ncbi:hypothetical protein ACHAXT_010118 [Thalassiosira profunda]